MGKPSPHDIALMPFLPALVLIALPALATHPRGPVQEGSSSWHALPLPAWSLARPPVRVPPALVDGVHLRAFDDRARPRQAEASAVLPAPLLEALLSQILTRSSTGASVQTDVGAVLVRGDGAAREMVAAELASLDAQLASLEVQLDVDLRQGDELLLSTRVRTASGREVVVGARELTPYVGGYDARVAADSAVADAEIHELATGVTLHLVPLRMRDGQSVRIEGFLDVAQRAAEDEQDYDPGLPDFNELELPEVDVLQIAFAGRARATAPLSIELSGSDLPGGSLTLTIQATSQATPTPEEQHWRMIDLSALAHPARRLELVHPGYGVSTETEASLAIRGAIAPASLIGLAARNAGDGSRPLWTDRLLFLPPGSSGMAEALARLEAELTPVRDEEGRLQIESQGFSASLPVAQGFPARLVLGRETVRVIDYDADIAPETWLAEPRVERLLDGICMDAFLQGGKLQTSSWKARSVQVSEVAPDGIALGRLNLPTRRFEALSGQLEPGVQAELLPELRATFTTSPL